MSDAPTLLIAVIEANIVFSVLYLFYSWALKPHRQYGHARFYLLSVGLISLIVSSTNIDVTWGEVFVFDSGITRLSQLFPMNYTGPDPHSEGIVATVSIWDQLGAWPTLLFGLLLTGAFVSVGQFAVRWLVLDHKLQRTSHFDSGRNIYITDRFDAAFAYLNRVYIPRSYFALPDDELELIIEHERGHIAKGHPSDRIFIAFIRSLFWYNPFAYKLEKELFAVHEFQIDELLADEMPDPSLYSSLLVKLQTQDILPTIVTQFSMQLIKSRVQRLHQTKSSKMKKVIFFLALPIVAGLFYAFSVQLVPEQIATRTDQQTSERPYVLPIQAKDVRSYNPFGLRDSPFGVPSNRREHHKGIDLVAPEGTPILAAASGVIEIVEHSDDGYGNNLSIRHADGSLTRYAHLQEVLIDGNARVEQGQKIGTCGSTGKSTGPHLHFELWIDNEAVDPESHLDLGSITIDRTPNIDKSNMVVILDAGHGGQDLGQVIEGVLEKNITSNIASRLSTLLESNGIKVVETRNGDAMVTLKDRVGTSDRENAIFISLHANAAGSSTARGVEMYIPNDDHKFHAESKALGDQFSIAFNESAIINRGMKTASFYVLKNSECPSILIELGFLSNEVDRAALQSEEYQDLVARQLAKSITAYAR